MTVTRSNPKGQLNSAFIHLYRACLAAPLAWALVHFRTEIDQILEVTTWRGFSVVLIGAGVAAAFATGFTVAAIRRIARWLTARQHLRMLQDPRQAALVPPLPAHLEALEPSAARAAWNSFGYLLFSGALVAVIAMSYVGFDLKWDADPFERAVASVITVVLFFSWVYGFIGTVRRWRMAQYAERLSRDRARAGDDRVEQPRAPASKIPPLEILFSVDDGIDRRAATQITTDRNVFGRKPWNIVYLRLFANEAGLQEFLQGAWRECGYVHFIRDVDSVSGQELEAADEGASLFINSRSQLLADLDRRPSGVLPSGTRELSCLAAETVSVKDEYGGYPVYAPLCHESFWKGAVDILLERADVAILDLSGYHWDNLGTGYELQRVIDRFPIERTVLLADPSHTDRPFLEAQIHRAWSHMAAGSPNAGEQPRQVIVGQVGSLVGDTSRALAARLQDHLDAALNHPSLPISAG